MAYLQGTATAASIDVELPAGLEPLRLLGRGGMASVWLAREPALKRLVAVKVLHAELAADEVCARRFEREAQAVARLRTDGVPAVHSISRLDDGRPCIVMEHIDGVTLADRIAASGAMPLDDALPLLAQLADTLATAHAQNIVHRDLKPANVLVTQDGRAALTDFGIAAILTTGSEAVTQLTRVDERLGDPRYASPEQLMGEPLTGQSDIYAFGVLACELLTGTGPFDDGESRDLAAAHLRKPPPDLAALCPALPAPIAALLTRCLSKSPTGRPQAAELAARLADPAGAGDGNGDDAVGGFLAELKQRKVYRAAAAYLAAVFVLLQALDLLLPAVPQAAGLYRYAVLGCAAGFPLALALAWIYDWRRGRLVRADESTTTPARRRLARLALGVTAMIAVVGGTWWWYAAG